MYELLARLSCPLCGGTRGTSVLAVLEGHDVHCLVRAQCVRCHLFWSFPLEWLAREGIESAASDRWVAADPISSDEVLDVHLMLRDFDGPLTALLPST